MTPIPAERQVVPGVSNNELHDSERLIDVRNDDEWALGRAPAARHFQLDTLEDRLDELDQTTRIVVTCRGGGRASRAVAFLREQGFDAHNLEGGMLGWQADGRPLVHDGPGQPRVE